MEEKKQDNKVVWIVGGIILIITLLIFVPGLIENKKSLDTAKKEYNLIKEGKTVSARNITEQFAALLSNKKYEEANKYLSKDCEMFDSKNHKRVKLEYCLEDLSNYISYTIEQKGNDLKNQETYRILLNGTKYENTNQIITLYLRKKIEADEVTYEIFRIIFTDNTLSY